ncbi:MAG: NAD(P)H-hydrate epimerase [Candidatus Omnitrophica bacterium]|nr:NAD(P)H-hydrate epimerase [Candidatus Omnitrophota bacterium]
MKKFVTAEEMKWMDQKAISEYGIPSIVLMENAGRGVAEVAWGLLERQIHNVLILSGSGNNGGDGMAAARHLKNKGLKVQVALLGDEEKLKGDAKLQSQIIRKMNIPIEPIGEFFDTPKLIAQVRNSGLIIDAVFGVGLNRPLGAYPQKIFKLVNDCTADVLAIDLPSGIHADTGEIMGAALKATVTATLAVAKRGLFEGEGPRYAGRICVVDIGIPKELLN